MPRPDNSFAAHVDILAQAIVNRSKDLPAWEQGLRRQITSDTPNRAEVAKWMLLSHLEDISKSHIAPFSSNRNTYRLAGGGGITITKDVARVDAVVVLQTEKGMEATLQIGYQGDAYGGTGTSADLTLAHAEGNTTTAHYKRRGQRESLSGNIKTIDPTPLPPNQVWEHRRQLATGQTEVETSFNPHQL